MHIKQAICRAAPDAGVAAWTLIRQCLNDEGTHLTTPLPVTVKANRVLSAYNIAGQRWGSGPHPPGLLLWGPPPAHT